MKNNILIIAGEPSAWWHMLPGVQALPLTPRTLTPASRRLWANGKRTHRWERPMSLTRASLGALPW
jgi:hypothetical protein